jgi:hypothetical protein
VIFERGTSVSRLFAANELLRLIGNGLTFLDSRDLALNVEYIAKRECGQGFDKKAGKYTDPGKPRQFISVNNLYE